MPLLRLQPRAMLLQQQQQSVPLGLVVKVQRQQQQQQEQRQQLGKQERQQRLQPQHCLVKQQQQRQQLAGGRGSLGIGHRNLVLSTCEYPQLQHHCAQYSSPSDLLNFCYRPEVYVKVLACAGSHNAKSGTLPVSVHVLSSWGTVALQLQLFKLCCCWRAFLPCRAVLCRAVCCCSGLATLMAPMMQPDHVFDLLEHRAEYLLTTRQQVGIPLQVLSSPITVKFMLPQ